MNDRRSLYTRPAIPDFAQRLWKALPLAAVCAAALAGLPAPAPAHAYSAPAGRFVATTPARILDTRDAGNTAVTYPERRLFPRPAVPADATAIAVNVTVTNGTAPGFLQLWPDGDAQPESSNVNWGPWQTVANLAEVGLAPGGLRLYVSAGSADVILDLAGYYVPAGSGGSGQFRPLTPARVVDTRSGLGIARAVSSQAPQLFPIAGAGNVPTTASAVVLNITVTNPTANAYVQVYPGLAPRPRTSNVNVAAGTTRANRAVVAVDAGRSIIVLASEGVADVIIDVSGYYTSDPTEALDGGLFTAVTPLRLLDTRGPRGGHQRPFSQWETFNLSVASSIPGSPAAGSVVLNVTATDATAPAYLQVRPSDADPGLTSDLNFLPASQTPNLVVVRLGVDGAISIYNSSGAATVIVDLLGWFSPAPPPGPPPGAPAITGVTPGDRSATVSWSSPAPGGTSIVSYYVTVPGTNVSTVVPAGVTSATLGGLTNTASYQLRVSATNGAGSGPPSPLSATVVPVGTPEPPTGVVATTPAADTVYLCWTAPANDGGAPITSYLITKYPDGQRYSVTPTCAYVTGQTGGIPLSFSVQAVNAYGAGPGAMSNTVVPPSSTVHHIVVSLSAQHMWVYQGSRLMIESDVTTGRPELPTPAGEYHIFYRASPYRFISPWPPGSPYYYAPAWTNWVLEFREGGYFLHDAPWRSWFGPGSQYGDGTHGCINIPTPVMQWLYGWANLGDWVTVQN